jgi:hypothetical protein
MVANAQTVVPDQIPATTKNVSDQSTTTTRNWTPTAKVSVGILAASIVTLLLPLWKKLTNTDLEATQATAITTLITFGIQYLTPEHRG